jgi:dihydroorotase
MELRGFAFVDGRFKDCRIVIEDGIIKSVEENKGERNVNGYILPAGIDIHVHFRDPGYTHKEDFYTGSLAAAFGGISCICDMPNTKPAVKDAHVLEAKREEARLKSVVDFVLYAQAGKNCDRKLNVKAYKLYTYEDKPQEADGINRVVSFHCEKKELFDERFEKQKPEDLSEHARYRNERSEIEAVKEVNMVGVKKHFAHLSSIESLRIAKGTKEVTPHHLLLNGEHLDKKDARFKVNPPIRNNDMELLRAFIDGRFDILASDHAPHTIEEKEVFEDAPSGMPGVETMYPIMLSLVKRKIVDFEVLISAICEKPAELFGLNKGRIKEGYDADLIFVDMEKEERIREEELHSKCGWSAFNGFNAIFPYALFVRGAQIIEGRELLVQRGSGKEIL